MILYIASFVIFAYVSFSLFWHSGWPLWLRAGGTLLVLLVSLKFEIYQWIGGAFFAPDLPRWLILGLEACYGALLILFLLLLLKDVYLLGNWMMERIGMPVPRGLPSGGIKLGLVALALILGIYATHEAIRVPPVHVVGLRIDGLPKALDGVRIAMLTDLHIGPVFKKDWLSAVVRKTNALEPDLIVLCGDYVDGTVESIGPELAPLAGLRARHGVLGVTGNHEYYWDMPAWRKALADMNIPLLENEHRIITIGDARLVVAGVPDLAAAKFGQPEPDLEKALRGAPEGVRLLLSHQPKAAAQYLAQVDAQFSGHTHGGLMFFLQPLVARFNSGFVCGPYELEDGKLYVSPGTGLWNGFSSRLGVPSEITEFVLRPGKQAAAAEQGQ